MAAVLSASSAGPSFAPEDPTLPKPWKGLVDGTTGYIYFWNPETNDTQYERPVPSSHGASAPTHKSSVFVSSSVQKPTQGSNHKLPYANEDKTTRSSSDRSRDGTSVPNGYGSLGVGSDVSQESYSCLNEISVTGGDVPPPLTSFEATGFPSEIVREVRYLLQVGAKCRTLFNHPLGASMYVKYPFLVDQNLVKAFRIILVHVSGCCW